MEQMMAGPLPKDPSNSFLHYLPYISFTHQLYNHVQDAQLYR